MHSGFGMFKKPDINDKLYLTYNCIHKPAILGIFGAILGFNGYGHNPEGNSEIFPEYYIKLRDLEIGIQPLNSNDGIFQKFVISYNNSVGYANFDGGNLIVNEQTLINPEYKIFVKLDRSNSHHEKLFKFLKSNESEYIPYFGKNEFPMYWDNFIEYQGSSFDPSKADEGFRIDSLFFLNSSTVRESKLDSFSSLNIFTESEPEKRFVYFERLPIRFNPELKHYIEQNMRFTNVLFAPTSNIENIFKLNHKGLIFFVQFF